MGRMERGAKNGRRLNEAVPFSHLAANLFFSTNNKQQVHGLFFNVFALVRCLAFSSIAEQGLCVCVENCDREAEFSQAGQSRVVLCDFYFIFFLLQVFKLNTTILPPSFKRKKKEYGQ